MKNRFFSLRRKLSLLIVGVVLLVAAGLLLISYYVFCETTDERLYRSMESACNNAEEVLTDSILWDLREAFLSEEYQALRAQAVEAGDESMIRSWMAQTAGTYLMDEWDSNTEELVANGYTIEWEYGAVYEWLAAIRENFGMDTMYLQYDVDGVTYNLIDADEGIFWPGSIEREIPEFSGIEDNAAIPPTYSRSEYGWLCTACHPIEDEETGEVICYVGADINMNDVVHDRFAFFVQSGTLVLLVVVAAIVLSAVFAARMTKPITELTRAAQHFSDDGNGLTKDKVISLNIHSRDEIGELYHEIRSMEERIVDYTLHLTQITVEKTRSETELRTAAEIQMAALPVIDESISERPEFELSASMDPAKAVGGDFYDFFLIDEDHLALLIADVSDKGVPAALFMMASKILLQSRARQGGSPSEILSAVNEEICRNNPSEMFVTVWFGILEISTGRLSCCNAGHEYPFLRQNGKFALYKDRHGMMIGVREGIRYRDYELLLEPGDALFVYTDGIPDAQNAENEFFGLARTEETLNAAEQQSAGTILDSVKQATDGFRGDADQFDDLTMLCLIYRGPGGSTQSQE